MVRKGTRSPQFRTSPRCRRVECGLATMNPTSSSTINNNNRKERPLASTNPKKSKKILPPIRVVRAVAALLFIVGADCPSTHPSTFSPAIFFFFVIRQTPTRSLANTDATRPLPLAAREKPPFRRFKVQRPPVAYLCRLCGERRHLGRTCTGPHLFFFSLAIFFHPPCFPSML